MYAVAFILMLLSAMKIGSAMNTKSCKNGVKLIVTDIGSNEAAAELKVLCNLVINSEISLHLKLANSENILITKSFNASVTKANYTFQWMLWDILKPNTDYQICHSDIKLYPGYLMDYDENCGSVFTTAMGPASGVRPDSIIALCMIFGYFLLSAVAGAITWKLRSIQMSRRQTMDNASNGVTQSNKEYQNGASTETKRVFAHRNYTEDASSPEKQPLNPTCSIEERLLV